MIENNIISFNNQQYIKYEVIEYRGKTVEFLSDVSGDQYFARVDNEIIDLGYHPISVKETIQRFIDRRLDLISNFRNYEDFTGAELSYFNNGGYRDIKLSYKGRLLKVYLVAGEISEISIISEAVNILRRIIALETD